VLGACSGLDGGPDAPAARRAASGRARRPGSRALREREARTLRNGARDPVYLTAPPGDLERVFVAEYFIGEIKIFDVATGEARDSPFHSIGLTRLLGMAFHPNYERNRFFFVYTEGELVCQLIRYRRSSMNPDLADAGSGKVVLELPGSAASRRHRPDLRLPARHGPGRGELGHRWLRVPRADRRAARRYFFGDYVNPRI